MIIGFCGPIGAGKTTAAARLVGHWGFTKVRFADPLKAMLRTLGLTHDETDGAHKERPSMLLGGKTPRWAMQTLGTEWGRDLIDGDLWVRAWQHACGGRSNVVADDVRFPNEVAAIHAAGGKLIRIARADLTIPPAHASETQDLLEDYVLPNEKRLAELESSISGATHWGAALAAMDEERKEILSRMRRRAILGGASTAT